jgi:hypothetical protein
MAKRKGPRKISGEPRPRGRAPNPGLPDPKTVVSERTFVSPKGRRYRIITTTDKDPYDSNGGDNSDDKSNGT